MLRNIYEKKNDDPKWRPNTYWAKQIKLYLQGGLGLVQDVRFSNIQVSEVQTPIIIDQFYCDERTCSNQTSAVAVSGVQYENIRGTFTIKPVHFACSDSSPCSGITLTGVQLRPVQIPHYRLNDPFCWQAFGELYTPTVPPIACLHLGKPAGNNLQSYHDLCWYTKVPSSIDWCLSMSGRETSDPFAPLLGGVHIYSYSDAIVTIARVTLQLKKR